MICLNFDIFRDLCLKHNLEPGDSVYNYSTQRLIVNYSSAIWGKSIEGGFKQIATFSPMNGVQINAPFKHINQNRDWIWIWSTWLVSYDEVEERFSLMEKNLKLIEIDKRIKDIDKDFVCKKNYLI